LLARLTYYADFPDFQKMYNKSNLLILLISVNEPRPRPNTNNFAWGTPRQFVPEEQVNEKYKLIEENSGNYHLHFKLTFNFQAFCLLAAQFTPMLRRVKSKFFQHLDPVHAALFTEFVFTAG
jgi:hypothetical protein